MKDQSTLLFYDVTEEPLNIERESILLIFTQPRPDSLFALYSYYLFIAKYNSQSGMACVTNSDVAGALKWGNDKVQKYKRQLKDLGLIQTLLLKDKEGLISGHAIRVLVQKQRAGGISAEDLLSQKRCFTAGDAHVSACVDKELIKESKKEKEQKEKKKERDFIHLFSEQLAESRNFKLIWIQWLDFRNRDIKAPITERAAKQQAKLLNTYNPIDAIKILETSMRNSWRGIFPLEKGAATNGTNKTTSGKYKGKTEAIEV